MTIKENLKAIFCSKIIKRINFTSDVLYLPNIEIIRSFNIIPNENLHTSHNNICEEDKKNKNLNKEKNIKIISFLKKEECTQKHNFENDRFSRNKLSADLHYVQKRRNLIILSKEGKSDIYDNESMKNEQNLLFKLDEEFLFENRIHKIEDKKVFQSSNNSKTLNIMSTTYINNLNNIVNNNENKVMDQHCCTEDSLYSFDYNEFNVKDKN